MPAASPRRSASTAIVVPSGAGVGSAIGFLRAPVGYEVVRSLYARLRTFDLAAANTLLADMQAEAETVVAAGAFGAPTRQTRLAFMRYVGQGHEIPVELPSRSLTEADVDALRTAFDTAYSRFYDRPVPGSDVEIMSYAVTVATIAEPGAAPPSAPPTPSAPRRQTVRDTATAEESAWTVHDRAALASGATIPGPAIIAEAETSTLIGPNWSATVDLNGYLDLRRTKSS